MGVPQNTSHLNRIVHNIPAIFWDSPFVGIPKWLLNDRESDDEPDEPQPHEIHRIGGIPN